VVTLYILVNTYWLPSELQKGEWEGRMLQSYVSDGGIGEDMFYHVDCMFAKKTNFSLKRSPSGK